MSSAAPTAAAQADSSGSSRDLVALGWDPFFVECFEPFREAGLAPARVAIEFKGGYRLYSELGERLAQVSGRFRYRFANRTEYPAVGDWVVIEPRPGERWALIQDVLPRKTRFSRKVAGSTTEEQIVAANVDMVFLMTGLDNDFNPRRIERYLVMARESGAEPVVLLNKADVCPDVEEKVAQARAVAPNVPVQPISSKTGAGLDAVAAYLRVGRTVALLGSSGVGKSTLINRLLGEELLRTQEVRRRDQRGRHTTTHRELVVLPRGGIIMDTPGMRELQLWDAPEGAEESFEDVESLALECHFPDCRHRDEPRCAVKRAIDEGRLDPARLESYRRIQEELDYLEARQTGRARADKKRSEKVATRAFNKHQPRR